MKVVGSFLPDHSADNKSSYMSYFIHQRLPGVNMFHGRRYVGHMGSGDRDGTGREYFQGGLGLFDLVSCSRMQLGLVFNFLEFGNEKTSLESTTIS